MNTNKLVTNSRGMITVDERKLSFPVRKEGGYKHNYLTVPGE